MGCGRVGGGVVVDGIWTFDNSSILSKASKVDGIKKSPKG